MSQMPAGCSDWFTITQEQINLFAEATHDHQYLHVDQEKAASGPFGKTIAHGFLYLSMVPSMMLDDLMAVIGEKTILNYGVNRLRFVSPVPVDSRIRLNWQVTSQEQQSGGTRYAVDLSTEIEGYDKPAMVAEWLLYVL